MSQPIDEFEAFFTGGGGPKSVSPKKPGEFVQGLIYKYKKTEERDDDGNVVCYPGSENPKPQIILWLKTDMRDPEIPNDQGERRLWMKGNALWALKNFLRDNQLGAPKVGGKIRLEVVELKANTDRKKQPMKIHAAKYAPPTPDTIAAALAFKELVEPTQAPSEDNFFGSSTPATQSKPSSQSSTLDSMRGFADDEPPF